MSISIFDELRNLFAFFRISIVIVLIILSISCALLKGIVDVGERNSSVLNVNMSLRIWCSRLLERDFFKSLFMRKIVVGLIVNFGSSKETSISLN